MDEKNALEERREVAERMRVYAHDFDFGDSNPFWYVAKAVFGDVDARTYYSVFARLADLIEPQERTCANIRTRFAEAGYECSECHFTAEELRGWRKWTFCPGCRARIMEVSE